MSNDTNLKKRAGDTPEKAQDRATTIAPFVDIYENADELLVVADLPGVAKDQMTINFDKGQLTIEGRRTRTNTERQVASEYRQLDYYRQFLVPQGIETDKIAAELDHGVLRVHLPKSAALKPRQIAIKSS